MQLENTTNRRDSSENKSALCNKVTISYFLEPVFFRVNKSIHAHHTNLKTKSHEMFLYLFRVMRVDHILVFWLWLCRSVSPCLCGDPQPASQGHFQSNLPGPACYDERPESGDSYYLAGSPRRVRSMTTETHQRGSGAVSAERSSGRLRPAPVAEPLAQDKPTATALMRRMSPAEFNTAMIHFYRGEVQRSNTWRNRLDTTTNWAVLTAGATLSFVFSSPSNPHFVIPINSILVAIFLLMEARRYRYYEIWSSRVRVLETGYFSQLLAPESTPSDASWAEHLASDLITPHFTITEWEAVGRRLRRNYLWIFALLALSWNLKVYLHPLPARDFNIFLDRATVGIIPGWAVFVVGVIFNAAIAIFAIGTVRLREATGEVLPQHEFSLRPLRRMTSWTTRAATSATQRTTVRAKRARQRVRSSATTGEFKKMDITESPDRRSRDFDISETPDGFVQEETVTRG